MFSKAAASSFREPLGPLPFALPYRKLGAALHQRRHRDSTGSHFVHSGCSGMPTQVAEEVVVRQFLDST